MMRVSHKRSMIVGAVMGLGVLGAGGIAAAQSGPAPAKGRCLTTEQQAVNDKYNALTRPTSRDDEMPFFDPEYFAGTWDFISRAIDSPLGPGGESAGTFTVKATNGCTYEGEMKGDDPDGKPFTRKVTLVYDPAKKHLTWTEVDSRGYTFTRSGPVGGELGGLFHFHYDQATPITAGGKKLLITGVSEMSSPAYFKADFKASIDGGPVMTFGRATFEKRVP
jgi:hypothetical protein